MSLYEDYSYHSDIVSYNVEDERHCDTDRCNPYCRCRVLYVSINKIHEDALVASAYPNLEEVDDYCVRRLLLLHGVLGPDSWEATIEKGYYGEELSSIRLNPALAFVVTEQVKALLSLASLTAKVEFILEKEYGEVLPALRGKSWEVVDIDLQDITRCNTGYMKSIEAYTTSCPIKGVLLTIADGKYRLIDGYHRFKGLAGNGRHRYLVAA